MSISDFLFNPYHLAHIYVIRPLFNVLIRNGHASTGQPRPELESQGMSPKQTRHFGDWPNLGAVSAPILQGMVLTLHSLMPFWSKRNLSNFPSLVNFLQKLPACYIALGLHTSQ
jgi:hypothetical protein